MSRARSFAYAFARFLGDVSALGSGSPRRIVRRGKKQDHRSGTRACWILEGAVAVRRERDFQRGKVYVVERQLIEAVVDWRPSSPRADDSGANVSVFDAENERLRRIAGPVVGHDADEIERWLRRDVMGTPRFKLLYPRVRRVSVSMQPNRYRGVCRYLAGVIFIKLPQGRFARTREYVLHEMAHGCAESLEPGVRCWHGPEFLRAQINLHRMVVGDEIARDLLGLYLAVGCRV
jgi:hypothetical protein